MGNEGLCVLEGWLEKDSDFLDLSHADLVAMIYSRMRLASD